MKKLHVVLKGEENQDFVTDGIIKKNKISYKENDILVDVHILKDKLKVNRRCSEYEINLVLEKGRESISTYSVFGGTKAFDLSTKTNKLIITDDKISVEYNLEGNDFKFTLEVIEN